VNSVQHRSRDRLGQSRAAGLLRLRLRRLWSRLYDPFDRILKSRRTRRRRRGVDVRRTWRRSRPLVRVIKVVSVAGGVVLLAAVAKALYVVILGKPSSLLSINVDAACRNTAFSCDLLAGTLGPLFSLAFASALFLLVRLWLVRRPYVRKAREEPQLVVETAGSMIGEVVGRDRLCDVIIEDLRDRNTRRPHVVIGGVGTGKTALLVRLTKLLAERGAVPVPVRLRDAQENLDFRELARKRFIADSYGEFQSDAEGERVWRQLCRNDRVVVLADGLEEALIDGAMANERDNFIRLAIRQASERRLPLIVASRPHDPLRETQAAIVELEPLGEEAALQYLQRGRPGDDERRLDWVVETADVTENPLYLQITRQLQLAGLMDYVTSRQHSRHLDTRSVDRAELRLRLLKTWMDALVDGHFATGVPLSREDRKATVEQLSVLACIGLQRDRLQVRFDDFETLRKVDPPPGIIVEVERALGELQRRCDIRLAATWGTQLGLVEAYGNGVRFPHSIIQAYLGSRLIDVAMSDQQYRTKALKESGRELLIAMVMNSRTKTQRPRPNEPADAHHRTADPGADLRLRDILHEKAIQHNDVRALYLHAAALQIDCVDQDPAHGTIANEIVRGWPELWAQDQRSLDEAKLNLVRCFGEAARTVTERRRSDPDCPAEPAYRQLYRIAVCESSYPIRVENVQEIGAGGDDAFDALKGVLGPADDGDLTDGQSSPRAGRAGNGSYEPEPPTGRQARGADQEEREWREKVIRAWLAPLLVGSVTTNARDAWKNLEHWRQFVSERHSDRVEPSLRLSLEVALAQGFKYAANRRGRHPHANPGTRAFLVEQAREMLRNSHFWFSRLTLEAYSAALIS
jgi:NACHT domain